MKSKYLSIRLMIVFFIFFSEKILAVIAYPYPVTITQRDGTAITVILQGDEKLKWARTPDDYTLVYNSLGIFEYGVLNESGDLVPSGIKARNIPDRTPVELSFLTAVSKKLAFSQSQVSVMKQLLKSASSGGPERSFPSTGTRKLVCLLIGFTDIPFTKTQTDLHNLFNQVGYNIDAATGSVKDFFAESSYGQLTLSVDVFGPFTANNSQVYYGGNNLLGDDRRPRELVTEAVQKADPTVNFADYDNDGDGEVDGVYVIYAGHGEEAGGGADCIWAHAWNIPAITCDGKTVSRYSCSPELRGSSGSGLTRIGVICHEFGHVLGAPDFYDTNYETGGQYSGTGQWDLQASGSWNNNGATPAHPNPYTKIYLYNWAGVTVLSGHPTITMQDAARYSTSFYQINTATSGEYFLMENRQQVGFDSNLPGHGLIIYHIHQDIGSSNINTTHPQKMYPVCASATSEPNSTPSSYGTINGDGCPFPGSEAKTSFTDGTIPSQKSWAGANTGMPVGFITEDNTAKTISFRIPETDATLSDLKSAGTTVPGFNSAILNYNIALPSGTTVVPAVTATTTDMLATKVITPAASLPGTTTVKVTAEDGATVKTYSVSFTVIPATPGPITGLAVQCPGVSSQIYSISSVTHATTYNWTVPSGWSITAGAGTTSITAAIGPAGQSGNVMVTAGNSGGTSSASNLAVTVNPGTPAQPGTITGTVTQCPAVNGQTYSISTVANATTYNWTIPTGWSVTGGSGTTSITVTTGTAGQNGNITVTAGNGCGTSSERTLAVTIGDIPATPGAITGTIGQCPGLSSQTYSINAVPSATTYTWNVPATWTITGGAGTTFITVTTGSAGQNGNISVTAGNSCGTSSASSLAVTIAPGLPATPGAIIGTITHCPGSVNQAYSISEVPNATEYTWTVPAGWTITGGAGTTSIIVTTGSGGQNGNITVTAGNSCGTSAAGSLAVTVNPGIPVQPGTITGTSTQCPSSAGQSYSISAVSNATTYTWTVPAGWAITSGAGTTSIIVTTGSSGQNGNITVTAGNTCGTSSAASLPVTVNVGAPATPGSITGSSSHCQGIPGLTYSISAVPNATTYTWMVPAGWTITGGAGTTSIIVVAGGAGQNGNITVTAGNNCGTSSASSLAVTVNPGIPEQPGTINGTVTQCQSLTGQTYSISPVTNATTYTWTVPSGWTITGGTGTTSIAVTTGTAGQNGNITVTAGNSCGTSSARTLAVTVNPLPATPGTIAGISSQCPDISAQAYSIASVANATTYTWTVPAGWTITDGTGTTSIIVTTGSSGQNGNITVTAGNTCGTSSAASLPVTVNAGAPATPGTITGSSSHCPGIPGLTYSISAVSNATTYTWTIPAGWVVTGGAGTTSIIVVAGGAGQNGNITVTAGNSCGTSSASLAVTVNPGIPANPGTINGTAAQCPSLTGQVYSISAVTHATDYKWTVPAGWTITGGAGTTTIAVTTGTAGQDGDIMVTAGNSCGTSQASSMSVAVGQLPEKPGPISGIASQIEGLTGQTYSVGPLAGVTSYSWTVPAGWIVTGGSGTNSITVTVGAAGQNGSITVTAGNACGNSPASSLAVTVRPAKSDDATLKDLILNGTTVAGFSPSTLQYNVKLPYGTINAPTVDGTANHEKATKVIVQAAGIPGQATIAVTAENGLDKRTYTVSFTHELNTDATLQDLRYDGNPIPGFSISLFNYIVQVPFETENPSAITAVSTDPDATIRITQIQTIPGIGTVKVTAADGITTLTYMVVVERKDPGTDATLVMIFVDGYEIGGFNSGTYSYNIVLPCKHSTLPSVTATRSDSYANLSITGITGLPGTVTLEVVAQDGITRRQYVVNFSKQECSSDASLKDLRVGSETIAGFDPMTFHFEIALNRSVTTPPKVEATPNEADAIVTMVQATGIPGTATIKVKAADGITELIYVVSFRYLSAEARLSGILIDNQLISGFDPDVFSYLITGLPDRTTLPEIVFQKMNDKAREAIVIEESKTADGFYIKIKVINTVTAEDGITHKEYIAELAFILSGVSDQVIDDELKVFPNPSKGDFNILFTPVQYLGKTAEITIMDALGRVFHSLSAPCYDHLSIIPISLKDCQSGIYFIRLRMGDSQKMARLVIE